MKLLDRLFAARMAFMAPAPGAAPGQVPEEIRSLGVEMAKDAAARLAPETDFQASGGYTGASELGGMRFYRPGLTSAAADINPALNNLISRSRDLKRNSPLAAAAAGVELENVIGTGLTLQCEINGQELGLSDDQAEAWKSSTQSGFGLFAGKTWADHYRRTTLYGLQQLAYEAAWEAGDVFALIVPPDKKSRSPYGVAVQLIEADYVSNPQGKLDSDELQRGVKFVDGVPEGVWISKRHPSTPASQNQWTYRPFFDERGRPAVIHLFHQKRIGQARGVPVLAPVIDMIKQLTRFMDAEVQKAVNAAVLNFFIKMDPKAFQEVFGTQAQKQYLDKGMDWHGGLQPNTAINLLPGEEPVPFDMKTPNPEADPFIMAMSTVIGAAIGIPREVLFRSFNSSYTAARGALLQAWKRFMIRRDWFGAQFLQPIYESWLDSEVAAGRVQASGYFSDVIRCEQWRRAKWIGDGQGSIDPQKEVDAAGRRMELWLTSLEQEKLALDGGDWRTTHAQRKRETELRAQDDLAMKQPAAPVGAQP